MIKACTIKKRRPVRITTASLHGLRPMSARPVRTLWIKVSVQMYASDASSPRISSQRTANHCNRAFDACNAGVVLRAVLLVTLSVMIASLFVPMQLRGWQGWLMHTGTALACALPGTFLWLMAACVARRWLGRLPQSANGSGAVSWVWHVAFLRLACWPASAMCHWEHGLGACWREGCMPSFWSRC